VLGGHPEVERFWFSYKEKQMRQEILDWYNALRETWGLARIGEEPEDTVDLILEDFRFRRGTEDDGPSLRDLHGVCGNDSSALPDVSETVTALIAETARGDIAGAAVSARMNDEVRILALEVRPEYRGLGVGEELLSRLIELVLSGDAAVLKLDLPTSAEPFSRVLYRDGFEPYETRFRLDLGRLRRERL
jgi:ribosomal protein S18 acetylase RimI-like enzyme